MQHEMRGLGFTGELNPVNENIRELKTFTQKMKVKIRNYQQQKNNYVPRNETGFVHETMFVQRGVLRRKTDNLAFLSNHNFYLLSLVSF